MEENRSLRYIIGFVLASAILGPVYLLEKNKKVIDVPPIVRIRDCSWGYTVTGDGVHMEVYQTVEYW